MDSYDELKDGDMVYIERDRALSGPYPIKRTAKRINIERPNALGDIHKVSFNARNGREIGNASWLAPTLVLVNADSDRRMDRQKKIAEVRSLSNDLAVFAHNNPQRANLSARLRAMADYIDTLTVEVK